MSSVSVKSESRPGRSSGHRQPEAGLQTLRRGRGRPRHRHRYRRHRIPGPGRPVGLRQEHAAAHGRRPGGYQRGRDPHRRQGRQRRRSRRTGTSRWCSRTTRSIRTSTSIATCRSRSRCSTGRRTRSRSRWRAPPRFWASSSSSTAFPGSSRAANGSAWRWAGRSCAIPKVFLFDEPLSNLDAKLRSDMRIEIKKLHQEVRTTIIYVTHDQVEAMTLADRIVVMNSGRIEQIGTPDEVYNQPASLFVAGFIGAPQDEPDSLPAGRREVRPSRSTASEPSRFPLASGRRIASPAAATGARHQAGDLRAGRFAGRGDTDRRRSASSSRWVPTRSSSSWSETPRSSPACRRRPT